MPLPFGASQDAVDAWQSLWPDERVPALGGATPRTASRRAQSRPRLEAVLREFEHDAYPLARAGRPAPDLERLRGALGMERGFLGYAPQHVCSHHWMSAYVPER
jgi:hypothetical protein